VRAVHARAVRAPLDAILSWMKSVPDRSTGLALTSLHQVRARRGAVWLEILLALLLAPAGLYLLVRYTFGMHAVRRVADDQVAIVLDNLSGARRVVATPGYLVVAPWWQAVYCLDKSPRAFVMEGNRQSGPKHVPRLMARAKDGSSFTFAELALQYALIPDAAGRALDDGGADASSSALLVRAYARSILRDEIGRYGVEDVARPDVMQAATQRSLERLNASLAAHGIEVLEIATPKPTFDPAYESLISRRKVFNQDAERLKGEIERLEQEKAQRETRVHNEKEIEMRVLEGNLARDVKLAEKDAIRVRQDADIEFLEKSRAASAAELEKAGQAAVLSAKYRAQAQDLQAETRALERFGDLAVRAALVQKLAGIEFSLLPYSRDPAPKRIEYEDMAGSKLEK
jgi:hypothetical protein